MPTLNDGDRLSSIDTAWYRMEAPENHANIGGLLMFDGPLDFDRVRRVVEERLVGLFPHFRHRVVESPGRLARPHWERDPDFSIDRHLHREALPDPGNRQQLKRRAGELMSEGLDLDTPLWRIHQLDNYRGSSVLLAQLHHCLGDGFALARVLLSIADEGRGLEAPQPRPDASSLSHRSLGGRLVDEIERQLGSEDGTAELVEELGEVTGELKRLASMSRDPETVLKRPLTGELSVGWSETRSLEELKSIARALDATLNDILMAGVTSALRRLLGEHGEDVDTFDIRAIVPVNLRPARSIEEMEAVLGNEFGLVFLELPIHAETIEERLRALDRNIDALKRSPEAAVLFGILTVGGSASAPIERIVKTYFSNRASVVVSNVPGPATKLGIADRELEDLMFWVPHPGPKLGLGISLISYAGRFSIGVRVDAAIHEDADRVVGWIAEAFDALEEHAAAADSA